MKRAFPMLAASALFCLGCIMLNGCSSYSDTSDEALIPAGSSVEVVLKELDEKGLGTISGQIVFDGDLPARPDIEAAKRHQDAAICTQGDITDQTWIVDPASKGVANVVVWVSPPKGHYFKKPDDKYKTWKDLEEVDQPHCTFVPHVVVLYPEYYSNGKDLARTGQQFRVLNSAPIGHNVVLAGSPDMNPAAGSSLSKKEGNTPGAFDFDKVQPDKRVLNIGCNVHPWMKAYAWAFDHPYAVVTDKDGKFTIKNVPAGHELTFRVWHESKPQPFSPEGANGKFALEAGKVKTIQLKISK